MNKKHTYITIYVTTREYGGPEEGGWWYNWTEIDCYLLVGKKKRYKLPKLIEEAKQYAESMDDGTEYWRTSHNGHYFVVVEHNLGSKASKTRPIYC